MSTAGQVIRCKAAVAWKPQQPLVIEEVEVAPPKKGEVRIKIMATGLCRTDASSLNGLGPSGITATFPVILGHEGAGVVESVGPGVTTVQPGDHVIPLYVPECGECKFCLSPRTNMCEKTDYVFSKGVLFEGTSRFTCRGKTLYHYMGCSTFSQYTVVSEICVAKIPDNVPLDKVCLLGCGISTGYGAAINTAQVEEGSTCAIWGLGGIGLAVAVGCKAQKAARIIGIDTNEAKFHMAREFGLTEFVNPNKIEKPIAELLKEMTNGGCDYTFECIGNVKTMRAAFESVHPALGVAVVIGVAADDQEVSVLPINFLTGRRWTGSLYGGWKSRSSMARLVNDYQEKTLPVDQFVTFTKPLSEINEGFDLMRYGKVIRTVVKLF